MPFEYLDHQADVGLRATGRNLEEVFLDGARGLMGFMYNLDKVRPAKRVTFRVEAERPELLFVEFLNEILSLISRRKMFFANCRIQRLDCKGKRCRLKAELEGEPIDLKRHVAYTEVKAATYGGLKGIESKGQYLFQCILDI